MALLHCLFECDVRQSWLSVVLFVCGDYGLWCFKSEYAAFDDVPFYKRHLDIALFLLAHISTDLPCLAG